MTEQFLAWRIRHLHLIVRLLPVAIILYLFLLPYQSILVLSDSQKPPMIDVETEFRKSHMKHPPPLNLIEYRDIHHNDFDFKIGGNSVMVFLHIQKTGGSTFSKHLVHDVDLKDRCLAVAFFWVIFGKV